MKENGHWITINGTHVFVETGQNPMDAFIRKQAELKNKKYNSFFDKGLDEDRDGLPIDEISEKRDIGEMVSGKGIKYKLTSQEINLSSPYVGKRFIRKISATNDKGNSAILSFYVKNNELIIKHLEGAEKGDGSGTMLLNRIIKESKNNNIEKIIADDTRSLNAGGYWEKQGFTPDNENNHYLIIKKKK